MRLFFDTEFTGLHKNTTLISIGIIAENGKKFYAEFTDYRKEQCNNWIRDNVLTNLLLDGMGDGVRETSEDKSLMMIRGTFDLISEELNKWLSQFIHIQFVSDVCHYDFVLLIDLITKGGIALNLPDNISPVCADINQDIAEYFCTTDRGAFNMSREQIVYELYGENNSIIGGKHNALYDAEIIQAIWRGLE